MSYAAHLRRRDRRIINRYADDGQSSRAVAHEFGLTRQRVLQILEANQVERRPRGRVRGVAQ